jgi:hypothetical protein
MEEAKKDLGTVGLGNLCMQEDMDLLYAATKIGNREMACFWEAPWLNGEK